MENLRHEDNQMLGFYLGAIAESEKPFSERDLERAGLFLFPTGNLQAACNVPDNESGSASEQSLGVEGLCIFGLLCRAGLPVWWLPVGHLSSATGLPRREMCKGSDKCLLFASHTHPLVADTFLPCTVPEI